MSAATRHFPPVVFQPRKKSLWNRFERKPLANRPEERVRLRFLDYLTLECGHPGSRIKSESSLEPSRRKGQLRADLICYDSLFRPAILVECKAESVPIDQSAAEQIARYNRSVNAPLLCITNGLEDHWFEVRDGNVYPRLPARNGRSGVSIPEQKDPEYWISRGFAGRNAAERYPGLAGLLKDFWGAGTGPEPGTVSAENPPPTEDLESATEQQPEVPLWSSQYLDIKLQIDSFWLDHYYKVARLDKEHQIAFTFLAGSAPPGGGNWNPPRGGGKSLSTGPFQESGKLQDAVKFQEPGPADEPGLTGTALTAILNRDGVNRGVLLFLLDAFLEDRKENALLITEEGRTPLDLRKVWPINPERFRGSSHSTFLSLPEELLEIFLDHL